MKYIQTLFLLGVVFSLLVFTACSAPEGIENTSVDDVEQNVDAPAVISDDTVAVAGSNAVVASVNGAEITSEDVAQITQLYSQQGQQLSEDQVVEQLINQNLLTQVAVAEGFTPSDAEVEAQIEQQLQMQNATLDEYKSQLQVQGVSYADQLANLKSDFAVDYYLNAVLNDTSVEVSEEEARAFYDQYAASSESEVGSFEEIAPQIKMSLEQQKQQEFIMAHIEELRSDADIQYS